MSKHVSVGGYKFSLDGDRMMCDGHPLRRVSKYVTLEVFDLHVSGRSISSRPAVADSTKQAFSFYAVDDEYFPENRVPTNLVHRAKNLLMEMSDEPAN